MPDLHAVTVLDTMSDLGTVTVLGMMSDLYAVMVLGTGPFGVPKRVPKECELRYSREPIARHRHYRDAPELPADMALLRSIVQRCRVASTAAARLNRCPGDLSMASFEGERTSHAIRGFMSQSGASSVDGLKSALWPATTTNSTHSLGFSGLVCQQVRSVMVEVTNDDLERAIRKMKRRLKDDNGIKLLRERQYHRKPSELKVLARKERDKRIAKKSFRAKLKWITARQARGF